MASPSPPINAVVEEFTHRLAQAGGRGPCIVDGDSTNAMLSRVLTCDTVGRLPTVEYGRLFAERPELFHETCSLYRLGRAVMRGAGAYHRGSATIKQLQNAVTLGLLGEHGLHELQQARGTPVPRPVVQAWRDRRQELLTACREPHPMSPRSAWLTPEALCQAFWAAVESHGCRTESCLPVIDGDSQRAVVIRGLRGSDTFELPLEGLRSRMRELLGGTDTPCSLRPRLQALLEGTPLPRLREAWARASLHGASVSWRIALVPEHRGRVAELRGSILVDGSAELEYVRPVPDFVLESESLQYFYCGPTLVAGAIGIDLHCHRTCPDETSRCLDGPLVKAPAGFPFVHPYVGVLGNSEFAQTPASALGETTPVQAPDPDAIALFGLPVREQPSCTYEVTDMCILNAGADLVKLQRCFASARALVPSFGRLEVLRPLRRVVDIGNQLLWRGHQNNRSSPRVRWGNMPFRFASAADIPAGLRSRVFTCDGRPFAVPEGAAPRTVGRCPAPVIEECLDVPF